MSRLAHAAQNVQTEYQPQTVKERERDVLCIQTDRSTEISLEDRGNRHQGENKEKTRGRWGWMRNEGCGRGDGEGKEIDSTAAV